MWQGLLALKNDQAAVQMYFVSGNNELAQSGLPRNMDGSTPPLRIYQRMRLELPQVEGVSRKMQVSYLFTFHILFIFKFVLFVNCFYYLQMENEHCILLALPCGHDHMDVLKQSTNLTNGFITYLQQKQAAGIVNMPIPRTSQTVSVFILFYIFYIFY